MTNNIIPFGLLFTSRLPEYRTDIPFIYSNSLHLSLVNNNTEELSGASILHCDTKNIGTCTETKIKSEITDTDV